MYLVLLSIVIMAIQSILGLADWWVLGSNWILAALVILGLILAFDHERLAGFNNGTLFQKGWILLASMLNLNSIYLTPELAWWKQALLAIGYASLISVGIGCWQSTNKPARCLLFGLIIALMSCIYGPMIFCLFIIALMLIFLSSYSTRNVLSIFSGIVFSCWIIYCIITLCFGADTETRLIQNFIDTWQSLSFSWPPIRFTENYTGIVYVCMSIFYFVIYALGGFIVENLTSLRIRSNITFQSTMCLIYALIMPSCWTLIMLFASISLCIQLIFALNEHPNRTAILWARFMLICYLVAGVGEPLFRLGWDYFMVD